MTERTYQRPETISIWAEVKDWAGNYVNPSEGVKITLTNPDGTVIVDNVAMTLSTTGKYVYYYTSLIDSIDGWWSVKAIAQDGTGAGAKLTIPYSGFWLQ